MSDAKNELKRLYDSIKESNARCEYLSDSIDFAKIIDQFPKTIHHNYPDGIVELDNVVYILEHFEVSAYREGKEDSLKKVLNSSCNKLLSKNPKGKKLDLHPSVANLCFALINSTEKHMKQYNNYLSNAKKIAQEDNPAKQYKFIFVIEEMGNTVIENENFTVLDILECTEILLSYEQIDGIIAYHHGRGENYLIALDRKNLLERSKTAKRKHQCELLMYHIACNIRPDLLQNGKRPLDDMLNSYEKIYVSESIYIEKKE